MADKSYKLTLSLSDGSTINAGTITAPQGPNGANGVTFTPSVSAAGVLSWTNNGGLTNPSPISIKGPKGDDAVITESDVEGWGFTRNTGTITEIKMNGVSKGKSGVVDLGTVLTAHTGLVGGNLVQYDSSAQTLKDSGKKISDLATTSQVNAKYTKPSGGIPKTDLTSDVKTSLGKADNAMPKSGGTFTGEVKFGSTENFQGYYIKRMIGSLGAGTAYANLNSSYKDGTWHRMWRLRFPSGSNFWGKIKITLYGGYSSFNASGVMSKSITCNFNTSNIYNNVGCYDGLGVNVEQDFRISEAIWNATVSAWEVLIWQKNLNGNNSPTIMLECWTTNNTNYINAFNGITAQTVELTQSTSYSAQKASSTGGTKTVMWKELPVYENPLGEEIATVAMLEDKQDKITSSNKLSSSLIDGLGAAAAKAVDTAISANSTSTNLPTSKAVEDRINAHSGIDKVGTITGIKMNSVSKGTSGVVDLGTVLTDASKFATAAQGSNADSALTKANANATEISNIKNGTTKVKSAEHADTADSATSAGTATKATEAMNVTENIKGHAIADIFETNGTTVKKATSAGTADKVANGLTLGGGVVYDGSKALSITAGNKMLITGGPGGVSIGLAHSVMPSTYNKVTVDGYGTVTAGENVDYLTSHQSIKKLNTNNTTAQTVNASEAIAGSGTINLHKVAKTGSYNDLSNKPTIPAAANNGTLTIQKNGTNVATFSANQSGNATANITVPTFSLSGTTLTITL